VCECSCAHIDCGSVAAKGQARDNCRMKHNQGPSHEVLKPTDFKEQKGENKHATVNKANSRQQIVDGRGGRERSSQSLAYPWCECAAGEGAAHCRPQTPQRRHLRGQHTRQDGSEERRQMRDEASVLTLPRLVVILTRGKRRR
jgi:hypothetical protein